MESDEDSKFMKIHIWPNSKFSHYEWGNYVGGARFKPKESGKWGDLGNQAKIVSEARRLWEMLITLATIW